MLDEVPLKDAQCAVIDEGARNFPRQFRLIHAGAILHAMHGRNDEARALIERGQLVARDSHDQEQIERLRQAIDRSEGAGTK